MSVQELMNGTDGTASRTIKSRQFIKHALGIKSGFYGVEMINKNNASDKKQEQKME